MQFKKNSLQSEIHVKFHKLKNRYRTHCFAIHAISVFLVKFNVEFTRQAVNISIKLPSFGHLRFVRLLVLNILNAQQSEILT